VFRVRAVSQVGVVVVQPLVNTCLLCHRACEKERERTTSSLRKQARQMHVSFGGRPQQQRSLHVMDMHVSPSLGRLKREALLVRGMHGIDVEGQRHQLPSTARIMGPEPEHECVSLWRERLT
jgi:hypothetical protein